MFRQDYLLREIERMVQFCLRLIGMKRQDPVEDLQEFLENHCEEITGLSLQTLVESSSAKLVSLLYHPGTMKLPQLVACGAWLCEAADVSLLCGRHAEARALYLRGAEILAFMNAKHGHEEEFAPIHEHLGRLRTRLDDYQLSPEERAKAEMLLRGSPRS